MYNEIDIFSDISEDDIENVSCVSEFPVTADSYLAQCKKNWSESIYIDISTYTMVFDAKAVRQAVYKLSYILDKLFDSYCIEHSEIILFDIINQSYIHDTMKLIDCKTYKCITPDKYSICNSYDIRPVVCVYVNYPEMKLRRVIKMIIRMLDHIWKYNLGRDFSKLIFCNVILYSSVISYTEYYTNWYKFSHIDFMYKMYQQPTENMYFMYKMYSQPTEKMYGCSDEIVKWRHYTTLWEWFMYRTTCRNFNVDRITLKEFASYLDKPIKRVCPLNKSEKILSQNYKV